MLSAFVLALQCCFANAIDAPGAQTDVQSREASFARLLKAEWDWTMREAPEWASSLGDFRYNDRWSDPSPAQQRRQYVETGRFLARFQAIDPAGFSVQERISLDLMIQQLKDGMEGYVLKGWEMPFDPQNGAQVWVAEQPASFDYSTEGRYEDYLNRLRALPRFIEGFEAVARLGVRDGFFPLDVQVPRSVSAARAVANERGDKNPFVQPALKFPKGWTAAQKQRWHKRLLRAAARYVYPTYRDLASFIAGPYSRKVRRVPGTWAMPNGEKLYRYDLRTLTTTDLTPTQLRELGLSEVQADLKRQNEIAKQEGYSDRSAYLAALRADRRNYFSSAHDVLKTYEDDIREIEKQLPKFFNHYPSQPLGVFEVPAFKSAVTDIAYYVQGDPTGKHPGRVMVNTLDFNKRLKGLEASIAYHEGEPGHHLQISLAMSIKGLPEFRKYGFYSAYQEGWALYCEGLAEEMGGYHTAAARFGTADEDMLRACRLVVDTGVHAFHWTRKQMVDYLTKYYITGPKQEIEAAVDRYIGWPGQACAYKAGQLEIRALRREAEQALGPKFDIRAFHDELLGQGALPLKELRTVMRRWIAKKAAE